MSDLAKNDGFLKIPPRKSSTLNDAVYRRLREGIINLEDLPGAVLTESAIATRYSVARPTAKAALEKLVAEGLLRRKAHRAAQVPILTREDVEDLYATRLLIEEAAVVALANTGTVPETAITAQGQLETYITKVEEAPFAVLDMHFHHALVLGHGSRRLARMHELIMGEIQLCMGQLQSHQLLRATDVAKQHRGLLDAIEERDRELAGFLICRHITNARDKLLTRFGAKKLDGQHKAIKPL